MTRWTATFGNRLCAVCGTKFMRRQPNAKYCSFPCYQRGSYKLARDRLKGVVNDSTPRTQGTCGICERYVAVVDSSLMYHERCLENAENYSKNRFEEMKKL